MTKLKGYIGFELEGFFNKRLMTKNRFYDFCNDKDISVDYDGSICNCSNIEDFEQNKKINYNNYTGRELKGEGFIFKFEDIEELFNMFSYIIKNAGLKVNSSCGLHFHISFENSKDYYKLCSYKFINQFQKEIKKILISDYEQKRLDNKFCNFYNDITSFKSIVKYQIKSNFKSQNRYYCINFNSYNLYKTIEFRIFPSTQKLSNFKKYVKFLLNNIEIYLDNEERIDLFFNENVKNLDNTKVLIKYKPTQHNTTQQENTIENTNRINQNV